ncbi:hypothetical protein POJ06DRAFT_68752 [Lipomyces tetrasporus]|uniref:Mid2 domain-containing protein n=1 Tax=Lipomyces tetrasporus TaxID=54092 RepID=A0AAD7VU46_9ASCO|nr:uncharacterized protein POJ06DRAFT_68752 [Lipomyces tetrasporus]KAJ8101651.1 hypothetical protein POJ06DRAFT_68752 [Lipomyces tetrasporus]
MVVSHRAFVVLLGFLGHVQLAAAVCYYPNGLSESDPAYQPCNQIQSSVSMCCATSRTNPPSGPFANGLTADTCLPNGMCQNIVQWTSPGGQVTYNYSYFRDQCTDAQWSSNKCLNVCRTGQSDGSTAAMTPCDNTANSTQWCCGRNNTACCNTPDAITLAQVLGLSSSTSSSISAATATSTSSPTTSSTSGMSPVASSASSGLSTGAKAGIGVGVGVGELALIFLLGFFFVRRQRASSGSPPTARLPPPTNDATAGKTIHEKSAGPETTRYELQGE